MCQRLTVLFRRDQIAKQWDPSLPGSCINTIASYYGMFSNVFCRKGVARRLLTNMCLSSYCR